MLINHLRKRIQHLEGRQCQALSFCPCLKKKVSKINKSLISLIHYNSKNINTSIYILTYIYTHIYVYKIIKIHSTSLHWHISFCYRLFSSPSPISSHAIFWLPSPPQGSQWRQSDTYPFIHCSYNPVQRYIFLYRILLFPFYKTEFLLKTFLYKFSPPHPPPLNHTFWSILQVSGCRSHTFYHYSILTHIYGIQKV